MQDRASLVLGTANFGNVYKGVRLGSGECHDILDAAWDLGIRWLDTARSYGDSEEIIGTHSKQWMVMSKGDSARERDSSSALLLGKLTHYLLHHPGNRKVLPRWANGVSIYTSATSYTLPANWSSPVVLNFPLNLADLTFHSYRFNPRATRVARSIFIRGRAFSAPDVLGIPFYHLCWNFAVYHPNVDMVIFGADSVEQLEDLMRIPKYTVSYSDSGALWAAEDVV